MAYPPEGWEIAPNGGIRRIGLDQPVANEEISVTHHDGYLIPADTVEMENVKFLDRPFIPIGSLTMLVGIGGLGKSHIAVYQAARVTRSA